MNADLEKIIRNRISSSDFLLIQKSFSNMPFAERMTEVPDGIEQAQFKITKAQERAIKLDRAKQERNNYCSFAAEYSVTGNFVFYKEVSKIPLISNEVFFKVSYQGFIDPNSGTVIESGVFQMATD
jgi:hypothetical protein